MKIRTKREFSGVPAGTTGTAIKDNVSSHGEAINLWKITWDLPGRFKPLMDWFDQKEFDMYLEKI